MPGLLLVGQPYVWNLVVSITLRRLTLGNMLYLQPDEQQTPLGLHLTGNRGVAHVSRSEALHR